MDIEHRSSTGKETHEYDDKTRTPENEYVIDRAAEKKLVRKLDLLLVPIIFIL